MKFDVRSMLTYTGLLFIIIGCFGVLPPITIVNEPIVTDPSTFIGTIFMFVALITR